MTRRAAAILPDGRPCDQLPIAPIPLHEFFKNLQWIGNPEAEAWQVWFDARGVRYLRVEVGRRFQLYTHRVTTRTHDAAWCCQHRLEATANPVASAAPDSVRSSQHEHEPSPGSAREGGQA